MVVPHPSPNPPQSTRNESRYLDYIDNLLGHGPLTRPTCTTQSHATHPRPHHTVLSPLESFHVRNAQTAATHSLTRPTPNQNVRRPSFPPAKVSACIAPSITRCHAACLFPAIVGIWGSRGIYPVLPLARDPCHCVFSLRSKTQPDRLPIWTTCTMLVLSSTVST